MIPGKAYLRTDINIKAHTRTNAKSNKQTKAKSVLNTVEPLYNANFADRSKLAL